VSTVREYEDMKGKGAYVGGTVSLLRKDLVDLSAGCLLAFGATQATCDAAICTCTETVQETAENEDASHYVGHKNAPSGQLDEQGRMVNLDVQTAKMIMAMSLFFLLGGGQGMRLLCLAKHRPMSVFKIL
jgi:hypothetical protein